MAPNASFDDSQIVCKKRVGKVLSKSCEVLFRIIYVEVILEIAKSFVYFLANQTHHNLFSQL
jgi:hypothetical protein